MVNHVKILDKIPDDIFNAAYNEILQIGFENNICFGKEKTSPNMS